MRKLHWLTAILVLFMIASGWYVSTLTYEDGFRQTLYNLHKSIGVMVIVVVCFRIMVRLFSDVPPLPTEFSNLSRKAAHYGMWVMYLLLLIVPLSGYVMSDAAGYGVAFFEFDIPPLIARNDALAGMLYAVHANLSYVLLGIAVLHVLAVLKHMKLDRIPLLRRML